MMSKTNQILAGIVVVQLIVAAVVFWPRSAPAASNAPLLPGVTADAINGLTIQDQDGNSVELKKQGDAWVLPQAGDYPADDTKIKPELDKLVAVTTNRLVASTAASHKQLQVSDTDFVRRVQITLADGKSHTLYVGSSPGSRATHVRVDSQNDVYLADDLASWELGAQAQAWAKNPYVNVPQSDITAITIQNVSGTLQFTKDVSDTWTLKDLAAGETANTSAISGLLGQVATVNLVTPLGKEAQTAYGLDQPQAVVTIESKSADQPVKTVTLTVGAKDATDNTYVVKSSDSPYYVRVAEYSAKDFVDKKRDDYLQLPPTPVPAPAATTTP